MMGNMSGWLDDAWNALVGKPQSWYTKVSNIQNYLNLTLAGIAAVGSDLWNTVSDAAQGPSPDASPTSGVDQYGAVVSAIDAALTSIIVTKNHVPSDAEISAASKTADLANNQLSYVESILPEMAQAVRDDQNKVNAMLPGPMVAPTQAGRDAFTQELEDRAKALGVGALDYLTYLTWGAGVLLGVMLLREVRR